MKHGFALRMVKTENSIKFFLRRPSKLMRMILVPWSGFIGQSWIKIGSGGQLTIFISKGAYDYLDSPGIYEKFCAAITTIINESAKQYLGGDERGALATLGTA